jgi:hypothetical protein
MRTLEISQDNFTRILGVHVADRNQNFYQHMDGINGWSITINSNSLGLDFSQVANPANGVSNTLSVVDCINSASISGINFQTEVMRQYKNTDVAMYFLNFGEFDILNTCGIHITKYLITPSSFIDRDNSTIPILILEYEFNDPNGIFGHISSKPAKILIPPCPPFWEAGYYYNNFTPIILHREAVDREFKKIFGIDITKIRRKNGVVDPVFKKYMKDFKFNK